VKVASLQSGIARELPHLQRDRLLRMPPDLRMHRSPDIYSAISQRGHHLVVDQTTTHDGEVSSTVLDAPLARFAGGRSMTANLLPDLERFWPSRRCHAFDEFCRG
jgi:hypothetical protein